MKNNYYLYCFALLLCFANGTLSLRAQDFAPKLIKKIKPLVVRIVYEKPINKLGKPFGIKKDKDKSKYFQELVEQTPTESFGTGFYYRPAKAKENYLITNEHVIVLARHQSLKAIIDGKKYDLEIVGADTFYDLAVLRFKNPKKAPRITEGLRFAPKATNQRAAVCVIAAPNGGSYVTDGKVTGMDVDRTGVSGHRKYIEHTALIIKGCSGSPLINPKGEVVGINTRYAREQLNLSYALNGILAQQLIHQIIASSRDNQLGRVLRPFLGIEFEQEYEYTGMTWDERKGVKIKSIIPNSPAANSPLARLPKGGKHYLTRVNGRTIENLYELLEALEQCAPHSKIELGIAKDHYRNHPVNVNVSATQLTRQNLEKIGQHFLAKYQLEGKEKDSLLAISGRFQHRAISINQGYRSLRGSYTERDAQGLSTHETYAGSPYESTIKYQIKNFFDLGVLVRLCCLEGRVALYARRKTMAEEVITIQVANYEDTTARALYF